MLEMSELDRFGAIWIDSDTFENFIFLTLANPSSGAQKSGFWELRELKIRDFEGSKNGPETSKSDS